MHVLFCPNFMSIYVAWGLTCFMFLIPYFISASEIILISEKLQMGNYKGEIFLPFATSSCFNVSAKKNCYFLAFCPIGALGPY